MCNRGTMGHIGQSGDKGQSGEGSKPYINNIESYAELILDCRKGGIRGTGYFPSDEEYLKRNINSLIISMLKDRLDTNEQYLSDIKQLAEQIISICNKLYELKDNKKI